MSKSLAPAAVREASKKSSPAPSSESRVDGRKNTDLRPVKMEKGFNRYAEGSCRILAGGTEVLCTASVEEGVPPYLKGSGQGWITAEYAMLPRSCQKRTPRDSSRSKPNGRGQEIQRLIGRSLRSIAAMERLGERTLWIDCDVIHGDGGTRCASITGAFVALHEACRRLMDDKKITQFPLRDFVAAVSVGIVGERPMLDLCYEEDVRAEVDMNLVMTGAGRFVELQGTAEKTPFSDQELSQMMGLGKAGIESLIREQKRVLGIRG